MGLAVASSGAKVVGLYADRLAVTRDGSPKDCYHNVVHILQGHPEWMGALGADDFAKRIEVRRPTPCGHESGHIWTTQDDMKLGLWLQQQCGLLIKNPSTIEQATGYVAKTAPFHPVREWLESIQWDGQHRVLDWLPKYLGASMSAYHMLVGQFFLVALVQRIYEPGCAMRAVPVFEGVQNAGKSSSVRALAEPWFADTPFHVGHKDSYQQLHGQLIYEISELESFNRSESALVKAFVSSREDFFRAPYDRKPEKHPRQTVFVATTNSSQYLKDWTGGTRFWPVKCGDEIDIHKLREDRDQLLAEALQRYQIGEPTFPVSAEHRRWFSEQQEERLQGHPWEDLIGAWLHERTQDTTTVSEVLIDACKVDPGRMNLNGQDAQRVAQILHKLDWVRKRSSKPGRPWQYHRPAQAVAAREPGEDDDIPL